MSWLRACRLEDLPVGQSTTVDLAEEELLVCRTGEAEVFAVDDRCTHDDGPLGEGRLEGTTVECPRHGARFDVRTGAVLRLPAASPLETYPVRLSDDGWVEVDLEEDA
jgi:3-phenylpropionate/trans-cinnamate dioxygenase ferredoxin subunit